jgi:membrane-associated phospholipid phosphatase
MLFHDPFRIVGSNPVYPISGGSASEDSILPGREIFGIRDPMVLGVDWLPSGLTVPVFFVTTPLLAIGNPVAGIDHGVAAWFHAHLTHTFVSVLRAITEFGSSEWIAVVLSLAVLFFIFKRRWQSLLTMILVVPGGMLLNEWLKILVHRHRPFVDGWFVDWSGYSFASGHTIGATLLYGQLALFIIPAIKSRHARSLVVSAAVFIVALVGFSRIALGAHYLTDVLAGMLFGTAWLSFCLWASRPFRRTDLPSAVAEILPETSHALVPAPVPVTIDQAIVVSRDSV